MKTFRQFLLEAKQINEANEDILLKPEDYQIYKNEYGFWNIKRKEDKQNLPIIVSSQPFKDYSRASAFLHKKIYDHNTKNILKIRTSIISKLHKLFKAAGMMKAEDTTSSIRGYRPITKNGYKIYTYPGDRTSFYIGVTTDNLDKEYDPKIKEILQKEGIKYNKSNNSDFSIDLRNQ